MNKYFLTDAGKSILYDRTRQLSKPVIFSASDDYLTPESLSGVTTFNIINQYDCKCYKLHDRLLFVFNLPWSAFNVAYQSFVLGFGTDISRETNSPDLQKLIYINPDNCYGGIRSEGAGVINDERIEVSQLKYGINTIIIPNEFSCSFLVDQLDNDLPLRVNSYDQLKRMYSYYDTL